MKDIPFHLFRDIYYFKYKIIKYKIKNNNLILILLNIF